MTLLLITGLLLLFIRAQTPTPFPVLPNPALTLPALTSDTLVFIAGGRYKSIALATAQLFASLGAHVTATTRNPATYNRSALNGSNVEIIGLQFGNCVVPEYGAWNVGRAYVAKHGRRPDIYIDGALTIVNGLPYHMTPDLQASTYKEYLIDPFELEKVWLLDDASSRPMTVYYISSFAGWAQLPYFQTLYNTRAFYQWNNVRAMNSAKLFVNTQWLLGACVFTNTDAMTYSINPSAEPNLLSRTGDYAAQQFQVIFKGLAVEIGIPPSVVALGAAQAILLRSAVNYETIFDVSAGESANTPAAYSLASLTGLQFANAYPSVVASFGINLTSHVPPTGAPTSRTG